MIPLGRRRLGRAEEPFSGLLTQHIPPLQKDGITARI